MKGMYFLYLKENIAIMINLQRKLYLKCCWLCVDLDQLF